MLLRQITCSNYPQDDSKSISFLPTILSLHTFLGPPHKTILSTLYTLPCYSIPLSLLPRPTSEADSVTAAQQELCVEVTCCAISPASAIQLEMCHFLMVEVMPNSDREVDDKDVPIILLFLLSFFISPSLPWPCGDVKPFIGRVVDRVLS